MQGTLRDTLKEVRPTFFLGVPRVWEKIAAAIKEKGRQITGFKLKISTWAKAVGLEYYRNAQVGYVQLYCSYQILVSAK